MKNILLLAVLTLMLVAQNTTAQNSWSSTSKGYVVNVNGMQLKIADAEFPKKMTWDNAVGAVAALGEGWRLPTREELTAMYQQLHVNVKGDFKEDESYWSNTYNINNTLEACSFSFYNGTPFPICFKDKTRYVRAVFESRK